MPLHPENQGRQVHYSVDSCRRPYGYTKDLLKRFLGKEQMRKPPPTPANADILGHDGKDPPCDRTEYLSKVMALMHVARFTRIDILYPVTVLATRSAPPNTRDISHVMRVFRFLSGTVKREKASTWLCLPTRHTAYTWTDADTVD
jgi:hypothetical protein